MAKIRLNINGKEQVVNVDAQTPVLWVLRDHLTLVGTKFGCGIAQCGACTVHFEGVAVRSCILPVSQIEKTQLISDSNFWSVLRTIRWARTMIMILVAMPEC